MSSPSTCILVGVDFGESADRALVCARDLAERLGARLELVYVYDVTVMALPELVLPANNDVSHMAECRRQLKALRDEVVGERVPARVHLRVGDPVTGILALSEEVHPDLIVVGSHGRGAVMRALLGSVPERLCRRSRVPVLVVPLPARGKEEEKMHGTHSKHEAHTRGPEIAWSCDQCGHIRGRTEPVERCVHCGADPAHWNSAPVTHQPVDQVEPATGQPVDESDPVARDSDPSELFATSPPGTSGYDVNPELRVRY